MEIKVLNTKGKDTGKKVKLNPLVFAIDPSDHAVYLDVKQHLANKRQGTHKSKERSEIVGSTRKIKKQKGTGTARAGNIKNPLFRGGGRVFGPKPRDYSQKVNKKVKRLARKSALSMKAKQKEIIVLENFELPEVKTSSYINILKALKIESKKSLLVLGEPNKNVYLSSRNLKNSEVITTSELNTYKILNAVSLILVENSISDIEGILS
ncbi:MAG: 50S ribosomal protein L4 [Flavobacteriaceae bacterium]|nr:50S ribosomal protein L4 [Flavobacteriaceae bacterium]|tara:strand:- start:9275 stop:9901 length:627 start_codon:yes stop_codon:yes gene_type:complete